MGMLDEAIREHLELKRRRGADPVEVAREAREALDPDVRTEEQSALDANGEVFGDMRGEEIHAASLRELDPAADAGASAGLQETAEIDMQQVFAQDARGAALDDDALEWETPVRTRITRGEQPREEHDEPTEVRAHASEQIPGQERMSFE